MMFNDYFLLAHLVLLLHGDMDQFERNKVINAFKRQEVPVLVATDVAGRMRSQLFYPQRSLFSHAISWFFTTVNGDLKQLEC